MTDPVEYEAWRRLVFAFGEVTKLRFLFPRFPPRPLSIRDCQRIPCVPTPGNCEDGRSASEARLAFLKSWWDAEQLRRAIEQHELSVPRVYMSGERHRLDWIGLMRETGFLPRRPPKPGLG